MRIKRMSLVVAGVATLFAILLLSASATAQDAGAPVPPEDAAVEEEAAAPAEEAEAAPPPAAAISPAATPAPAPAPEPVIAQAAAPVPPPAPEPVRAEKPKSGLEVKPYAGVQYRFWERIHSYSDDDNSASVFDHTNRLAWRVGLIGKVDDQFSLQIQIGNDWFLSDDVTWALHNFASPPPRQSENNLYIHIASFKWDPGYFNIEAGAVNVSGTNGTLDLLERSLNTGKYGGAVFTGWTVQSNGSLAGLKLGVPFVKSDNLKVGASLLQSIIDSRQTQLPLQSLVNTPNDNPASWLFVFNVPVEAGDFKVAPEITGIVNRNYNRETETGDHEIIGGLSASYKVSDGVSLTLNGAYGSVSNENSRVGVYGNGSGGNRSGAVPEDSAAGIYISNGLIVGAGASIKAGPGSVILDLKYNSEVNAYNQASKDATANDYFLVDLRYTWKVHKNFTVLPRFRSFVTSFAKNSASGYNTYIEYRPELSLNGEF